MFYNKDTVMVHNTLSESDGYFSYMGLAPGRYMAAIDPEQMRKLNMKSSPEYIPFTVEPSIDGDYIFDLEFVISSVAPVSEEKPEPPVKKEPEPEPADTLAAPVAKPAVKPVTPPADTVAVPVVIPAEQDRACPGKLSEPTGYRCSSLCD